MHLKLVFKRIHELEAKLLGCVKAKQQNNSHYSFRLLLSIVMNSGKYSGVHPFDTILPL